ncbi:MAG: calcium/sodium antiporter [Thermoanaerobaculia bacterium]
MDLLLLLVGVGLLYLGGEGLVRGGVGLGKRLGLSPLVIGLTIVSCGTSSPELAASLAAVLAGSPAIAVGNVVGSNIANLGLVLGITAVVWPLTSSARFFSRDTAVMLGASLLLFGLLRDDRVGRIEGTLLLGLMATYVYLLLTRSREDREVAQEFETVVPTTRRGLWRSVALVLTGTGLLVLGAKLLVAGAVGIAHSLGVSERVIGLTMVAFGTSLPELAASLVAAMRHHSEIVFGNLIGSNIFNILMILGATAAVHPVASPWAELRLDLLVMLGFAVLGPMLLFSGQRINRWEGGLLLLGYGGYVALLFR